MHPVCALLIAGADVQHRTRTGVEQLYVPGAEQWKYNLTVHGIPGWMSETVSCPSRVAFANAQIEPYVDDHVGVAVVGCFVSVPSQDE
jgi:hypothetical protein